MGDLKRFLMNFQIWHYLCELQAGLKIDCAHKVVFARLALTAGLILLFDLRLQEWRFLV